MKAYISNLQEYHCDQKGYDTINIKDPRKTRAQGSHVKIYLTTFKDPCCTKFLQLKKLFNLINENRHLQIFSLVIARYGSTSCGVFKGGIQN